MKQKFTALAPCAAALAAAFYLLPLLMRDTGTAMLLTLCVMPLAAFVPALIHGLRRGFSPLLPLLALLLFLPTVPLYYNASAWGYALFYAALVLAGNAVGRTLHKKR